MTRLVSLWEARAGTKTVPFFQELLQALVTDCRLQETAMSLMVRGQLEG